MGDVYLSDLFSEGDLQKAIDDGYVRTQTHPTLPYVIFNYTELAQFARHWTPVTRQCRGLIVNSNTGEVLARPLQKFMNANEPGAYIPRFDERAVVSEKRDGSLGVGFPTPDGYAIATRGSFTSEQALHATALWRDRYAHVEIPSGITPLWEIIYPFNRVVVDHGDFDDLVLLGAVDIATGRTYAPGDASAAIDWPGPVTEIHPYSTLAEVLVSPERENFEGYVLHFPDSDERLKWKHDWYKALHRILTNVTARHLWEFLAVNACWDHAQPRPSELTEKFLERRLHMDQRRIEEIRAVKDWRSTYLQGLPGEFREWVEAWIAELETAALRTRQQIIHDYAAAVKASGLDFETEVKLRENRSHFVKAAQETTENWRVVMTLLDGNETHTWCWLQCYPEAERPFRAVSEESA